MQLTLPRIVFAGVSSGVGKTTIIMAFIAHLRTRDVQVQPFKVGPDYIDPSHLALAPGRPCYNLDTLMMPSKRMLDIFCHGAASVDIAVIEGMMGSSASCKGAYYHPVAFRVSEAPRLDRANSR